MGRGLAVDVEANPPRVTGSSEDPRGEIGSGGSPGSETAPITFPWTVSLGDPLLLSVVASATSCYCVWSAEIPWVSGAKRGTIKIDNEGHGYKVVGIDKLIGYTAGNGTWNRLPRLNLR
jgi:hypothetical protein